MATGNLNPKDRSTHWSNMQYWFREFEANKEQIEPLERAKLALRMVDILIKRQARNESKAEQSKRRKITKTAVEALRRFEDKTGAAFSESQTRSLLENSAGTTKPSAGQETPPVATPLPPDGTDE